MPIIGNDTCVAAIFGVTGLVGKELARKLLSTQKWKVYGIARRHDRSSSSVAKIINDGFICCDLLNSSETQEKLVSSLGDVTHIFWVTWATQFPLDSLECFHQNRTMLSNALDAILPSSKRLRHVSLQTGTKHYVNVSLQDHGGVVSLHDEESPRVVAVGRHNFYYGLEDLLQERLEGFKAVSWSVQRPGLILGCSDRTLFNFMGSLCVYGSICKYLNLPFVFGGTKHCWEEMCIDVSDARLVAEQHVWAATAADHQLTVPKGGRGFEAFNAINGEKYSWKEMWRAVGAKLTGYDGESVFCEDFLFSSAMADKGEVWKEIVGKEGLVETEMGDLVNWDFMDVLFRCPVKMLAARDKVDRLGFKTKYHVLDSILYWIDVMRAEKLIP